MRINDRLLTLVTGAVLAVGGATASLFLGEDETNAVSPVVVASLATPAMTDANVDGGSDVVISDLPTNNVVATAPAMPEMPANEDNAIAGVDADVILAAVEPNARETGDITPTDLINLDIVAVAPELAFPADITDIVLTRTPVALDTPVAPRVTANLPSMAFDIAELVEIRTNDAASCALDIRATPIFGARVKLKLIAPCHPNVVVTIKHAGLQFKERLDGAGAIELKIPAFAEYSRFDIELADGMTSTVGAYIAGLSALERVGIAWAGANDTFLHAMENGAVAGGVGHIWRVAPNTFAKSRMNGGGYMMTLGNPELENAELAQVYTLPQRAKKRAQVVDFEIETLRGEYACGADMTVRMAQHRINSGAAQSELSLTMPACGSEDTSLVLKNAIKDMKVARK